MTLMHIEYSILHIFCVFYISDKFNLLNFSLELSSIFRNEMLFIFNFHVDIICYFVSSVSLPLCSSLEFMSK